MVSWKVFNDLYENQYDAFRKLKFFVKAGKTAKNEILALEMIEDFLAKREIDLERIRLNGLEERVGAEDLPLRLPHQRLLESSGKNGNERSLVVASPREPARSSYWNRLKSMFLG